MNKQQMEDREQFRRYAEAALSGLDLSGIDCSIEAAKMAFDQAIAMMLQESRCWEIYQLHAPEAIVDDERIKHECK